MQRFFNSPKAESLSCYKPYTKGEYKESYLNIKRPCNNPVRYDLSQELKSVQKTVLTDTNRSIQKQPSWLVLKKRWSENMQQIYMRTPMPKCDLNKVALQLYWNRTSAWVFSCKFAAYFQTTFFMEDLWVAASEHPTDPCKTH